MRQWIAIAIAVCTLSTSTALAGSGSNAFAGECVTTPEPHLAEVSELLSAARDFERSCRSADGTAVSPDPHVITTAVSVPVFHGPREFGRPSGEETIVVTSWLPVALVEGGVAPRPVFALRRFGPYRNARERHEAFSRFVDENIAKPLGGAHARYSVVGPGWWKKSKGKSMQGLVHVAAEGVLATALIASTGPVGATYLGAKFVEDAWNSPLDTGEGSSEIVEGIRTQDLDRALDGYTQACSGLLTALSVAVPLARGGRGAISARPARYVHGVTVVDKFTGRTITGPIDLQPTIQRIRSGGAYPHKHDGSVYRNDSKALPPRPVGYYREYVHPTPGFSGPGPQRIVMGRAGELYYSPDHYRTFIRIK